MRVGVFLRQARRESAVAVMAVENKSHAMASQSAVGRRVSSDARALLTGKEIFL
jgi:hypothetical protein